MSYEPHRSGGAMRLGSWLFMLMVLWAAMPRPAHGADALTPLDARQVRAGGEIGRRIRVTIDNNLLMLNVERDFLAPFREKTTSDGFIGLGMLIDAAVRFGYYSGDPWVLTLKRRLVTEALKLQLADGYLGIMRPERRISALWDVHEMSYLIYGLTSEYRFFKNEDALKGAKRLADYVITHWPTEEEKIPGAREMTLHMAVTGSELAMLALHQATGDPRYLEFCMKTRKLGAWDAHLVTGRFTPLEGHAYAHLSRCLAQLRMLRLRPNEKGLAGPSRDAMRFMMQGEGMTIPGEIGDQECWHDTQEGTLNLGESCATAYLLRFLDDQLRTTGDSRLGDVMERVIYNGLFAAQSPDGRQIRYYTPFDGPRSYFAGDTYCCPNNYRRIVAELPEFIYYQNPGGVTVNLYASSKALVTLPGGEEVRLTQRTDYPTTRRVEIAVDPARDAKFALRLRLPAWCSAPAVSINGLAVRDGLKAGSFMSLERLWKNGDKVVVELPGSVRLVRGRLAQAGRVALMYGPQLYGLRRAGNEDLANVDLRLVVIDPATVSGPEPDATVRPGGTALRIKAWDAKRFYPSEQYDYELKLTEYADPACEAIYFKVPNPKDARLVDDELFVGRGNER